MMPFQSYGARLLTMYLVLWTAPTTYGLLAQSHGAPTATSETSTINGAASPALRKGEADPPATTVEEDLRVAENAVAQAMLALAQVQVPIAMLKMETSDHEDAQALLDTVESYIDTAMNAYQNAVLASNDETVHALATEAQIAAMAAQVWGNIAVARLQLHLLHKRGSPGPRSGGGTGMTSRDRTIALATQALNRAVGHAEATQAQMQASVMAARQVESAFSPAGTRAALDSLRVLKASVTARTMATGAQVMLLSAHATGDPTAIAVAYRAADAAEDLIAAPAIRTPKAETSWPASRKGLKSEVQLAVVRARMAMATAQVALAQGYVAGFEPSKAVKAATTTVADQVKVVVKAQRTLDTSPTEDSARMVVEAAQAVASAAVVAARVADAYIRLEMVQERKDAALVQAARLAASAQLRTAVVRTQEAIASAAVAQRAAKQVQEQVAQRRPITGESIAAVRHAKEQTKSQAYLGIAWAQSASYWTQAAWAWTHHIEAVAVASEAAAVAAESTATMIESNVGVAVGVGTAQESLDLSSASTFVMTASLLPPAEIKSATDTAPGAVTDASKPLSSADDTQVFDNDPRVPPVGVASPSR